MGVSVLHSGMVAEARPCMLVVVLGICVKREVFARGDGRVRWVFTVSPMVISERGDGFRPRWDHQSYARRGRVRVSRVLNKITCNVLYSTADYSTPLRCHYSHSCQH